MTYAPNDLLVVRNYFTGKTGLDAVSLGIVGDPAHAATGGYHEGKDDLERVGVFGSDYSTTSSRDYIYCTNAASALDVGLYWNQGYGAAVSFSNWIAGLLKSGDPRLRDLRGMNYTPDGSNKIRIDRLYNNFQATSSSDSVDIHTHFEFFRDSDGRRANDDNFLGVVKQYFGDLPAPATDEDEDMGASFGPIEINKAEVTSLCIPPVAAGAADPRLAWLNVCNDTFGAKYGLRIWWCNGGGGWAGLAPNNGIAICESGKRYSWSIPTGAACLTVSRVPINDGTEAGGVPYAGHLTLCVERGPVIK
jgi:hypothetical protein